jgi:hypothetical protein
LTIFDHSNVQIRTLLDTTLRPGYYQVTWNGRNEAGKNMPPGVYVARLAVGEGPSEEIHEIRMFLWNPDVVYFREGCLTTSDAEGNFGLRLSDLPIGELVPFWTVEAESLGSQAVLSTFDVGAVTDSGFAVTNVDVFDRQNDVSLTLRIHPFVGPPANRPLQPTAPHGGS